MFSYLPPPIPLLSVLLPLPKSPTLPYFQHCAYTGCPLAWPTLLRDWPSLPKRCPPLPKGKVVSEEWAALTPRPLGIMCCVNMVSQISASCPATGWNPPSTVPLVQNSADRWTHSGIVSTASLCQLYWRNNTETGVSMPASCHHINTVWHVLIVGWLDPQTVNSSMHSCEGFSGCGLRSHLSTL